MFNYLSELFGREETPLPEHRPRPLKQLKSCDVFGRELLKHSRLLPSSEMKALLPYLFNLGEGVRPIDLRTFKKSVHWPREDQHLRAVIDEWWEVLRRVVTQMCSDLRSGRHPSRSDTCPINRYHLPLANAIVWLHLHHQGKRLMPKLLSFLSNCLFAYPNCPEVTQQLAQNAANMLVHEPYFAQWKPRIAMQYPELMRGSVGQRLLRA